jgi:hypothetical protein
MLTSKPSFVTTLTSQMQVFASPRSNPTCQTSPGFSTSSPRMSSPPEWVASHADRVVSPRLQRQDLLKADVVLPAVGEVVLVKETLTDAQAKVESEQN